MLNINGQSIEISRGDTGAFTITFTGADAPEEEAGRISERFRAAFRRTEVIRIDGGQPIYDYILILE